MNKSSLSDFFDVEEETTVELSKEKIICIDAHNLAYRTVFSAIAQVPTDNSSFLFWKHLMIQSILGLAKKFEPTKIIMAFDGFKDKLWRKEIYAEYKSQRKAQRDKSIIDFDKFFPIFNETIDDLKYIFSTMYTIKIDGCEADDIIAVLCKEKFADKQIIIVSTDGDMNQLLVNKNVSQFNPLKNSFVESINIKQKLLLKVITGDKSDNIPAIKAKVGIKTAEKIINEGLDTYLLDADVKANYERNLKLIDFNYIPTNITQLVLSRFDEYKIEPINGKKLFEYFIKNRMNKNMDEWQSSGIYIKELT